MNSDTALRNKFKLLPDDAFDTWCETGTRRLIEDYILLHATRIDSLIPRGDAHYPSRIALAQLLLNFSKSGYLAARITDKLPSVRFNIDDWTDIEMYRDIEKGPSGTESSDNPSGQPVFSRLLADSIGFLTSQIDRETLRVLYEIQVPEHSASTYVFIFKNAFAKGISLAVAEALVHGETLFLLPIFPDGMEPLFEHYLHIASLPDTRPDVVKIKYRMREILRIRAVDANKRIRDLSRKTLQKLTRESPHQAVPTIETPADGLFETRRQLVMAGHAQALIDLAIARGKSEHYQEAAQLCCDALSLDPNHPQALRNLGLSLFRMGMHSEAEKYTEKVCGPKSDWQGLALLDKSNLMLAREDYDLCTRAIRDAIRCGIVIDESIQARILIDTTGSLIQHRRYVEALAVLDASKEILGRDTEKQARGDVFRLIGAIAIRNIDDARDLYSQMRDTAVSNDMDTVVLLGKLEDEPLLHSEFIDFCHIVYTTREPEDAIRYVPFYCYFSHLIRQAARESKILQQIDLLLSARTDMQLRFRTRFVELLQSAIRSVPEEMEFTQVMRMMGEFVRLVSSIALRSLSPYSFYYDELHDVLLSAMSQLIEDVKPWPDDNLCECGRGLREYSVCDCGYSFPQLDREFVTRIPIRKLRCPVCGDNLEGFRCDACGRIYSWFAEG